jgi:proline iminopeptidase
MEAFVPAPPGALWTLAQGRGTPVLMVSGGPGCCDYLGPVAELLDGQAMTIRFDARGCGRSSPAEAYTLAGCLADIERIREHYQVDDWIVVGHSAGADHALAYALQFPGRTRAVICLAGGRIHNDRDWHAAYSTARDAGLEAALDYAFAPNLEVNRQLNLEWKAFGKRPRLLREFASLAVPALFVYGSEDIRPSWPIEQLCTLLPGAEWRLIEGAGHNLWLTHAELLSDMLRAFVADPHRGRRS